MFLIIKTAIIKSFFSPIIFIFLASMMFYGCEEPVDSNSNNNPATKNNTLLAQNVGNGSVGALDEYFYNFDDAIDAKFFRYARSNFNSSYEKHISTYPYPPNYLVMRNFPDHLLDISPDSNQFVTRHPIDTLVIGLDTITSDIGKIVQDSLLLSSSQFKNLQSIEWDLSAEPSLQRYRLRNSGWIQADTTLYYADTFDVKAYWAIVDTPLIDNGFMFVDTSEWRDTSYSFNKDELMVFTSNFEFSRTQLHTDSLIFRINTDCNDNNIWDQAEIGIDDYNNDGDKRDILFENNDNIDYNGNGLLEDIIFEFVDRGNGRIDLAEAFHDINQNGIFDLNEPYEDRNCNDRWDDVESFDKGNGKFDDVEEYILRDYNEDGIAEKHLFKIGTVPNNLLVDWADSTNPKVLLNLNIGDDLVDRWGNSYEDIIETVSFTDTKRKEISDIDSLVTLYTNDIVGSIDNSNQVPNDFYVTKTEFIENGAGNNSGQRTDYDYQIFSKDKHISQHVYKSYFLPPGFYWSEFQIDQGFWYKKNLEKEIYLYSYNGLLRDGEHVDTSYYDTTEIATYLVEKSFFVEKSEVTVPAANIKSLISNGTITCLRDNSIATNEDDCPGVDTTFNDCFKITSITNMTMMGSGVEYGQKTYTWLAKNYGIVKSDLYMRWTENPFSQFFESGEIDENGNVWYGFSKIELANLKIEKAGNLFRQIFNPAKIVKSSEFENLPEFNFDPFKISNQSGFHTIRYQENFE